MKVLVTEDGFLFAEVSNKAKEIFKSNIFELYEVHEDSGGQFSESLIEDYETLDKLLDRGDSIYIELTSIELIFPSLKRIISFK